MVRLDPMFFHEERAVRLAVSSSPLRKLVQFCRRHNAEVGLILALLVVRFSFWRTAEKAMHKLRATVPGMVRSASQEGIRLMSEQAGKLSHLGRKRNDSNASSVISDSEEPRHAHDSGELVQKSDATAPRFERTANFMKKHMDRVLMTVLSYKILLLMLYTMPVSYGFGAKRSFLKWASKAAIFRVWLLLAPVSGLALVGAAGFAASYSRKPVSSAVATRWQMLGLMNTMLGYSTLQLFQLIRGDPEPLLNLEDSASDRDLLSATPPPMASLRALNWPFKLFAPPVFSGLENLPAKKEKLLFVGNHLIWGLDVGLLIEGLLEHAGVFVRPLGEHSWFSLPVLNELVFRVGAIDGTRHNCNLLMKDGANLLVYPGGARESWKRTTDPPYSILWGDHHLGFVLMAVTHGYTIVPVASVGMEDVIDPVYDMPLDKITTLGGLLKPKKGSSKAFAEGAKLPLPRISPHYSQRNYFRFLPPLDTASYQGQQDDKDLLRRLRDETKLRLQKGIEELKEYRKTDPDRFVYGRNPEAEGDAETEAPAIRSKM